MCGVVVLVMEIEDGFGGVDVKLHRVKGRVVGRVSFVGLMSGCPWLEFFFCDHFYSHVHALPSAKKQY